MFLDWQLFYTERLDLLEVLGKKHIFPQMVVFDGDLPWKNPKKITLNSIKQTIVTVDSEGSS